MELHNSNCRKDLRAPEAGRTLSLSFVLNRIQNDRPYSPGLKKRQAGMPVLREKAGFFLPFFPAPLAQLTLDKGSP